MKLHETSDDSFEQDVLQSKIPVIVDFWAEWCGPCKMIAPVLVELASEMDGKVKICKMNVDENPNMPSSFGIRSIPTLMLFQNGKQISSKVGVVPKQSLIDWINSSLEA